MSWCDCEEPTVAVRQTRKARKAWRCYECRLPISVGSKYQELRGLWDGRWETYRTCPRCVRAVKAAMAEPEACFCIGGLKAYLHERIIDRARDRLALEHRAAQLTKVAGLKDAETETVEEN